MNYKGIDICCPHCKGDLDRAATTSANDDRLRCVECERIYRIVAGIPDLRVFPDPYIDVDADYAKGLKVAEQLDKLTFPELIDYYYSITSVVPPKHAKLYARGLMAAAPRAEAALESWEKQLTSSGPASDAALLEIGCGTAPLLVAAAPRFKKVVGIDVAFRWLVVARKRLDEAGLDLPLICACAEALPFRGESFDRVVADSTLEVVKEQHTTLAEANRVLRPGGAICVSTPNRFSIGPDPHTGVWGGSWLPESVTAAIVRRQGGIPPKRKLLSAAALRHSIRAAGFTRPTVMLPDVPEGQRKLFTGAARLAVNGYRLARRMPVSAQALRVIGPILHAVATKPASPRRDPREQRALVSGAA